MVTIETTADRRNGITTVQIVLSNGRSTPQLVRIRNALEGPVWPPRPEGVPDPRWADDVWESTIEPGRTRGIGFATPAPPTDPLVEILTSERVPSADLVRSPAETLAELDDWRPPMGVFEPVR